MRLPWIDSNTFHHSDFDDLSKLCLQKAKTQCKISLCIPTFNEGSTIAQTVRVMRELLVEQYPLLDEIVVIDSGSKDMTKEQALSEGAEFFYSGDILPQQGFYQGKGENLWKAVYQLKGDIICYVDADITNIHPRFVYGLVGPLLSHVEIGYVKGFYERPLSFSKGGASSKNGGRVTELLARPLLSMFYPELAQLFQPLSGEYAVRRSILESIPFSTGYGVEAAHLLDVYAKWGIEVFGQVDLDKRIHHNKTTAALGKMSFSILQTVLSRLQEHEKVEILDPVSTMYNSLLLEGSKYEIQKHHISESNRPPMNTVPEYWCKSQNEGKI